MSEPLSLDSEAVEGTVITKMPKSAVSGMEGVKNSVLSLEELALKHGILPWEPSRSTCSVEAEAIVRRLGRMPREAEPWMPAAILGPLIIFAHYDPTCREFWGVPERLTVQVVVSEERYQLFYEDLAERLRMTPIAMENAMEFLELPPKGTSLMECLQWYMENYPLEKADTDRIMNGLSRIQSDNSETVEAFNEVDRHLGVALLSLSSGHLVFNPEEVPPQKMFPDSLLEKHEVIPLHCGKKRIYLLTAEPSNYAFEDEWLSGGNEMPPITMVLADKSTIRSVIGRHRSRRGSSETKVKAPQGELHFSENSSMVEIDPAEIDQINPSNINVTPSEVIQWVIYKAIMSRASDLHVERYYNLCRFRARIDGKMRVIHTSPDENLARYVALIKNYANMAQTRQETQDARFAMTIGKRRVDVRVSAIPCRKEQQKLTLRFLDKQDGLKTLGDLTLSDRQTEIVTDVMSRDQGLILVTGPTGSGKTTTLYALINSVDSEEKNVHTIEDPIEFEIEGINQTQTDPFNNIDFPRGLRALLRADPDVILIGESRDQETANAAVNAALTGHLVLTTLHANDCIRAVSRLLSMGVPSYLLADSLAMSQAQRLVRRLCKFCKRPIAVSSDIQRILARNNLIDAPMTAPIYAAAGCPECQGSGYHGRVALMEMCLVSARLSDLIARGAPMSEMRVEAAAGGVKTLYQEGLSEMMAGTTTLKEVSVLSYTSRMED